MKILFPTNIHCAHRCFSNFGKHRECHDGSAHAISVMEFQQVPLIPCVAIIGMGFCCTRLLKINLHSKSEDKVRLHVRLDIDEISFVLCLRHFAVSINCCVPDLMGIAI